MACFEFQGLIPVVDPSSYVHPTASLIGDVIVGPGCYIGPGASLRGDFGRITIAADANVQDCATIHVSASCDTVIGRGATIAHGAVIHGCRIGENCLIGINAVVLDEADLGPECLVAALSLVPHAMVAPARSMLVGVPARIRRTLAEDRIAWRNDGTGEYQILLREVMSGMKETDPLPGVEPNRGRTRMNGRPIRIGQQAGDSE